MPCSGAHSATEQIYRVLRIRCRAPGPLAPNRFLHHRNAHGRIVAHVLAAKDNESELFPRANQEVGSYKRTKGPTSSRSRFTVHFLSRHKLKKSCSIISRKRSPARMQLLLLHLPLCHPSLKACMPRCVYWRRTIAICTRPLNPAMEFEDKIRTFYSMVGRGASVDTSRGSSHPQSNDEKSRDA